MLFHAKQGSKCILRTLSVVVDVDEMDKLRSAIGARGENISAIETIINKHAALEGGSDAREVATGPCINQVDTGTKSFSEHRLVN
jgi:transcription antitermination factor NusA-like protein